MQNARKLYIQNWMQHALFKQSRQELVNIYDDFVFSLAKIFNHLQQQKER